MRILKRKLNHWRLLKYIKRYNGVFLYHHIGESGYPNVHNISFERFKWQIEKLSNYYKFVQLNELFNSNDNLKKAAITFDDGSISVFKKALPFLQNYNIPATIFINKSFVEGKTFWRDLISSLIENNLVDDFILSSKLKNLSSNTFYHDSKDPLKVDQIELVQALNSFYKDKQSIVKNRQLANLDEIKAHMTDLIQIGNHSANHFLMSSLSFQEQFEEISLNKSFINSNFDQNQISNVFAIPFGDSKSFNSITIEAAKSAGYTNILSTESSNYFNSNLSPVLAKGDSLIFNRFMPKEQTIF